MDKKFKQCPTCGGTGKVEITLSDRLRTLREAKGMTQGELSQLVSISRPQIANLEKGRGEPSLGVLREICEALDTTADFLLFGEHERGKSDAP